MLEGIQYANQRRFARALGAYSRADHGQDPMVSFYIAHAHMELGDGRSAIRLLSDLTESVAQPALRADLTCTLGDAYTVQRDLVNARDMYLRCRELDKLENFRALKALAGS